MSIKEAIELLAQHQEVTSSITSIPVPPPGSTPAMSAPHGPTLPPHMRLIDELLLAYTPSTALCEMSNPTATSTGTTSTTLTANEGRHAGQHLQLGLGSGRGGADLGSLVTANKSNNNGCGVAAAAANFMVDRDDLILQMMIRVGARSG